MTTIIYQLGYQTVSGYFNCIAESENKEELVLWIKSQGTFADYFIREIYRKS